MSVLMRVLYYLMILVDGDSYVWSCVANECLMVQMHVSYESDVLYICVSDSCGGFLYAPTIFDVWFLCFFVGSFWLKLGWDIKCQPNFSL